MKRIITLVTVILLVTGSAIVLAQPINQIIATRSPFPIVINGTTFNSQKNVISVDGTTYVPVRDFCKALNTKINWSSEKKAIEVGIQDLESISKNPVTINDYKFSWHGGKSSPKGEGRKFFYIYVALKNIGNGIIHFNYATDFKVQDNHGNEYNSIPLPGEQSVYEKKLSPEEEYIGTIPFDVPMEFNINLYTIIFKSSQVEGEIRKKISFDPM